MKTMAAHQSSVSCIMEFLSIIINFQLKYIFDDFWWQRAELTLWTELNPTICCHKSHIHLLVTCFNTHSRTNE